MSIDTTAPDAATPPVNSGADHFGHDSSTPSATTAAARSATASPEFVRAVSDFLDTDPTDILRELGYYDRDDKR